MLLAPRTTQMVKLTVMVHVSEITTASDICEHVMLMHIQLSSLETENTANSSLVYLPHSILLTVFDEGLSEFFVRKSGHSCKMVLCLEGCLLICNA